MMVEQPGKFPLLTSNGIIEDVSVCACVCVDMQQLSRPNKALQVKIK